MQDYVSLMSQMQIVRFLEGLVAKYWIPSYILSVKVSSTVSFVCKKLQLLGAATIKLGGHNF